MRILLEKRAQYLESWLARRAPRASRVRLEQRRIYILPSAVGLAYLAALGVMLLAAINYQNSLAYALTFLLLSVFLVAILHTWRNLAGLELHAGACPSVFVGEQAGLGLRLESGGRAHLSIGLGFAGSELIHFDVPAGGACDAQLNLPAERRGWLRPGRIRVESRFPLGLLVAWSWIDLGLAALVYPQPLEGLRPHSLGRGEDSEDEGESAIEPGADDYQGLRSWQPGDSTRRLDWKAFSRGRGLLVKEFAALTGSDLLLDFDTIEGDTETRLGVLCHWVMRMTDEGQPFVLSLPGQLLGPDSGAEHRERCLRALALFGSSRSEAP